MCNCSRDTADGGIQSELSKDDEVKLRHHLAQMLEARSTVLQTVVHLESVHMDICRSHEITEAHRLDLENAVLMQELMAVKVGSTFY